MLTRFEVTGFKNFKETVTLDFSDVRDYKFNSNCITGGLISKLIIYGKNAIGKTNFGYAILDIQSHLSVHSILDTGYYLNVASLDDYATFRYVFRFDDSVIDYRYRKNENQQLLYEKLLLGDKLLYEYDYVKEKGNTKEIEALAPTLNWTFLNVESIVKYVIHNTILDDTHPLRQMMRFVNNMLWFRSSDERFYTNTRNRKEDFFEFVLEPSVLREFETFLHSAGIDEKLAVKTDHDGKDRLYFDTNTPLPFFEVASSGTKALYSFFYCYKTKKDASLMFIDEFDAFYHFELAETIVTLLEKMNNTQVLLTSHNTNLLSNHIMRPDCYFILTKDKLTSFANATDRELREGHNLEKLFMSGEFNE